MIRYLRHIRTRLLGVGLVVLAAPALAAPTITAVALSEATGLEDGYLNYADSVTATVTFSTPVTVSGTPQLTLTVGTAALKASYASGSGGNTLAFTYKMTLNRTDTDGISIAANALLLNGGTIQDGGAAADLSHAAVADDPRFRVDSLKPATPTMALESDSGTVGDRVTDTGGVRVTGVEADARWEYRADYGPWQEGGSGLIFPLLEGAHAYQVRQTDAAGNVSSTGSVITFTLNPPPAAPTVLAVALSGATGAQNGALNAGDTVTATVTLSEAVLVTGTPQLVLDVAGVPVSANYVGGTTTPTLRFTATILAGQQDDTGISLGADALRLNGGTIRDGRGNDALLSHAAVADHPAFRVDTSAPLITLASDKTFLETGETAALTITLSEPLADFGPGPFTVSGGTLRDFSGSDTRYTATFYPALGGAPPGRITVDGGRFSDAAGNPNDPANRLEIGFIPVPDPTPDAFSFPDQVDAPPQTRRSAAPLTLTGFNVPIPVAVSGDGDPQLSINGGDWVTQGTLEEFQTLAVRLTSAAPSYAWHTATVVAGGVSGAWRVRTADHTPPVITQAALVAATPHIDLEITDDPAEGARQITRAWAEVERPYTGQRWTLEAATLTTAGGAAPWVARIPVTALGSGRFDITLYAEDAAGNRAAGYPLPSYQRDREPPVIQEALLSAGNRALEVRLSEQPVDGGGQVARVWVEAETAPGTVETVTASTLTATATPGEWLARVPLTSLPSGQVTLRVRAEDDQGQAAAPLTLGAQWLDNTPPVVTAAVVDPHHQWLEVTLSDGPESEATALVAVWLEVTTGGTPLRVPHTTLERPGAGQPWQARIALATVPSGVHTLRVFGRDAFGNVSTPLALVDTLLDHTPPVITAAPLDAYHRAVEASLVEGPAPEARTVSAFWLEATAHADGAMTVLPHQQLLSPNGDGHWLATSRLADLASGYYALTAFARDAVGNVSAPYLIGAQVLIDTQAPAATLWTRDGTPLQARVVHDLGEITIQAEDDYDPQPTLVSVTLSGASLASPLPLSFRPAPAALGAADAAPRYVLDYPATAPLLADGEYTLTVTVRDAFQHEGTSTATFSYATRWLPLLAANGPHITLPLLDAPVDIRRGNKQWPLTTEVAAAGDAPDQPLRGVADLVLTLGADAQEALVVDGQPLNPGQSLLYPAYNFDAAGGRISLPLRPLVTATTTEGWFGELVIRIDRPLAPVVKAPVYLWSPATQLALTSSAPTYAKKVHKADLWLADAGDALCSGDFVALHNRAATYPTLAADGLAKCAVRWTALPPGLKPHATYKRHVTGFLDTLADQATLQYEVGLFVAQGRQYHFYPARPPGADGAVQTYDIPLYEPQPPTLVYSPVSATSRQVDWLPAGVWATRTGKYIPGTIHAQSAPFSGLVLTVTDQATGAVLSAVKAPAKTVRAAVTTQIPAMEGEMNLIARVHYSNYPEVYQEAPLRFVALPQGLMINLRRPTPTNNYADTIIHGAFGEYKAGAVSYDPVLHGAWTLRLYREYAGADGLVREQLGADTRDIAPDGSFAINAGPLAAGGHRVLVTATYDGDAVVSENMLKSSVTEVAVLDGAPVTCTMSAKPAASPPGVTASVRVIPDDRRRYDDVSVIRWERSTSGADWEPLTLAPGHDAAYGYGEELTAAGLYRYRAVTVNRHSGREAACPETQVHIYDVPRVILAGHNYTLLGTTVDWTAQVPDAPRATEYQWTVRRGYADPEPLTLTGPTVTLPADSVGSWYVEVRARYLDSPASDRVWGVARGALRVDLPRLHPPRIVGEDYVEAGVPARYTAHLTPPWHGYDPAASLSIAGEWELPDGTVQTGESLTYTPTTAPAQRLRYRAWIRGHQAASEVVSYLDVRAWSYVFPTATLTQRRVREAHPTTASFLLALKNGYTHGEPLTTTWTFPPGVTVDQRSDTQVLLSAWEPGDYPVAVQVTDARGHEVTLTDTLHVAEPPPLALTSKVTIGDAWQRAPAPVTLQLYPAGRMAGEQIVSAQVRLNGTRVHDQVATTYRVDLPEPGEHTLDVTLTTNYDRQVTHQTTVTLIAGEPPRCTLSTAGTATALKVLAACEAPMGKIVRYQWQVTFADAPEQPVDWGTHSAYQITLQEAHLQRGVVAVTLVATNDKGQTSPVARWSPSGS